MAVQLGKARSVLEIFTPNSHRHGETVKEKLNELNSPLKFSKLLTAAGFKNRKFCRIRDGKLSCKCLEPESITAVAARDIVEDEMLTFDTENDSKE